MRSKHGDEFNHDNWAEGYDRNVTDETDPIRAGYGQTLDWVAKNAGMIADSVVLDLGCGTGNLTERLPECSQLVCVDISEKMLTLAKGKIRQAGEVEYVCADVLEYFDDCNHQFDAIVSTYAIHYLTASEKAELFALIHAHMRPGGTACFGDLAFENVSGRRKLEQHFLSIQRRDIVDDFEEEFFWDLEVCSRELRKLGFQILLSRFSDLSWGVRATRNE